MKMLILLTTLSCLITGCGEVAWQRKYNVPIQVYVCHSPNAQVNLTIEIPVEMLKKPDTKPNINPNLTVPLVPGSYILEVTPDGTEHL